jgi:hypothetical protein
LQTGLNYLFFKNPDTKNFNETTAKINSKPRKNESSPTNNAKIQNARLAGKEMTKVYARRQAVKILGRSHACFKILHNIKGIFE